MFIASVIENYVSSLFCGAYPTEVDSVKAVGAMIGLAFHVECYFIEISGVAALAGLSIMIVSITIVMQARRRRRVSRKHARTDLSSPLRCRGPAVLLHVKRL